MLPDKNIKKINFQIREIDILFKQYKALIDIAHKPDIVEITALASVLHSYYNGLKKYLFIFKFQTKLYHQEITRISNF